MLHGHILPQLVLVLGCAANGGRFKLEALFVGVRCPVEVLMHRRCATGWTETPFVDGNAIPEEVLRWSQAVHEPGIYDLEIDTSRLTAEESAAAIRAHLESGPLAAFTLIAAGNEGDP